VKRRQQNQKFPSFQIFRLAAGGVGGAANKNDRKFFGFAPREQGVRGRGAKVIRQNPADFARNSFELRPIHTAMIRKDSQSAVRVGHHCERVWDENSRVRPRRTSWWLDKTDRRRGFSRSRVPHLPQ